MEWSLIFRYVHVFSHKNIAIIPQTGIQAFFIMLMKNASIWFMIHLNLIVILDFIEICKIEKLHWIHLSGLTNGILIAQQPCLTRCSITSNADICGRSPINTTYLDIYQNKIFCQILKPKGTQIFRAFENFRKSS